jgi:hypothetical protein
MRSNGVLPDGAPPLGSTIETDLAEHGFALLRAALALRESEGPSELASKGFERAARAFEALVRNGDPTAEDRGFKRTIAATAYHLAGFSAVAYSLFNERSQDINVTPGETAIMLLILRNLDDMRSMVRDWLTNPSHGDARLAVLLEMGQIDADDALVIVLNGTICRALAFFDFALETGEERSAERARSLLETAISLADTSENVPLWWIAKLARSLIDDLWTHSLHKNLPLQPPQGGEEKYNELRKLFIGSLYARKSAEVELWPSQREAVRRSVDVTDDLVVALPTSAGKTRIAEIAALMTLASSQRVLIVTPLRALSAQTERSFRRTFAPLGFSVSSLYGASGLSSGDEDALRSREIVISTPEKLDFALRNDPALIEDVGLIVLDEGHMIGPSEREIRYEILVQRLLRRADAAERRIVCLSAVLPEGEELADLTSWIRSDQPGDPVLSEWRPTRQRYGTIRWQGASALLKLDQNRQGPFIARFVSQRPPRGKEKLPYPRDVRDLTLFAAWEFAAQGKRTLVFSTQANWVAGYGKRIVDLCKRGYLGSLLEDSEGIKRALEVGREWLGDDHPAVLCLQNGVAIHHGRLPSPFLRELEILLSEGTIRVIVASPTLAQGLNLNAAVLLVPSLYRAGQPITGEEFANVAGRAGRAFVDVEGLILHVMFNNIDWRASEWRRLIRASKARSLKSGLIQVIAEIISRLTREGVLEREDAIEYLANSREAWRSESEEIAIVTREALIGEGVTTSDEESNEKEQEMLDEEPLSQLVERLDAAVFGLVEALDADSSDLPQLLDEALNGSLWARQIAREETGTQDLHRDILRARAGVIWSNSTPSARKGHFAMGIGLEAGLQIDAMSEVLEKLLDQADECSIIGDIDGLSEALIGLGDRLLTLRPFVPDATNPLPTNWKVTLRRWISGDDVDEIGSQNMRVVEEAFTYRLVWALEAIRTRRIGLGWSPEIWTGGGAASLETGVPQFMMAMLIRAGLPSRRSAMAAIRGSDALFTTPTEMREWLASNEIAAFTDQGGWPTSETAELWKRFRTAALSAAIQRWSVQSFRRLLETFPEKPSPDSGLYRVLSTSDDGRTWLATPDYQLVAPFRKAIRDGGPSLIVGKVNRGSAVVEVARVGRGRATWPLAKDN